nr:hypothetical protein [Tanacetum cinerariifolium]
MVGTCGSTPKFSGPAFEAAVQRAVDALLPGLTTRLTNEIRQNGAGEVVTNLPPSTHGWKGLGNRSLDLLAPQPLQLKLKTGLLTLRRYSRFWDVLMNSRLGWQVTSLKEMLSIGGRLLNKPKEVRHIWLPCHGRIFFLQYFPMSEQQKYEREYHTILQRDGETSGELMKRFLELAGFVGKKAGPPEEQAKHFKNMEILHERSSQNNRRNRDGDRIRLTAQDSNQRGYNQKGYDGRSYDQQDGNNNQKSRGQQYNRSSGSSGQKIYPDYASSPPCDICKKLHLSKACHRVTRACFTCGSTGIWPGIALRMVETVVGEMRTIINLLLRGEYFLQPRIMQLTLLNYPFRFDDKIRSANLFPLDMNDFDIKLWAWTG